MNLQEAINQFREQEAELQRKRKELAAVVQSGFADLLRETIFAQHPGLTRFEWRQYTPYFNDGENCEFTVYQDYLTMEFDGKEFRELDAWTFDERSRQYHEEEQNTIGLKEAYEAVRELLASIPKELYLSVFGDHARVVCTPNRVDVVELNEHY